METNTAVLVERWEWEHTNGAEITLAGYDADGKKVAERTFEHTATTLIDEGERHEVNEAEIRWAKGHTVGGN